MMNTYKLLTPGPLTTTATVKEAMMIDHCTWDDDYKRITQDIRKDLLGFAHVSETDYTTILMQGSGFWCRKCDQYHHTKRWMSIVVKQWCLWRTYL